MNDVESRLNNGATAPLFFRVASNLHFPFNISFNGNKLRQNGDTLSFQQMQLGFAERPDLFF